MDVEKVIREYLSTVIHMSLATTKDAKPWVCEVHFVFDDELNLYFRSKPSSRHSQEIANNKNVAGNIVAQHQLKDKVRGVYFEGTAEQLLNVGKDHLAYRLCQERFGLGKEIIKDAQEENGHKFYKITVNNYYLFDSRQSNPSQKYLLAWHSK